MSSKLWSRLSILLKAGNSLTKGCSLVLMTTLCPIYNEKDPKNTFLNTRYRAAQSSRRVMLKNKNVSKKSTHIRRFCQIRKSVHCRNILSCPVLVYLFSHAIFVQRVRPTDSLTSQLYIWTGLHESIVDTREPNIMCKHSESALIKTGPTRTSMPRQLTLKREGDYLCALKPRAASALSASFDGRCALKSPSEGPRPLSAKA